jgi:hypothetical protein
MIMKNVKAIVAIAGLIVGTASAARSDDMPTFERDGMPMTVHQTQILASDGVYEQPPASRLTLGGMPASPHQLAVLTPRHPVAQHPAAQ